MHRRRPLLLIVAVFAAAACGGGAAAPGDTTGQTPDEPVAAGAPPSDTPASDTPSGDTAGSAAGDAVEVTIGAFFQYDPDPVEVTAGTTVRWVNPDAILHTATSGAPGDETDVFDIEMDGAGTTGEFTFEEPGEYSYFCTVHKDAMKGTVVVI